jgi:hypothetical protein
MEEKVVNMLDAKHVKGKWVEFEFELTSNMLSRALFANSCSIEVDIIVRVPTHTKDSKNNMCAWQMNTSSIMMHLFICTSPLVSSNIS